MKENEKRTNLFTSIIIAAAVILLLIVIALFVWINKYDFFPQLIKNGVPVCFLGKDGQDKIILYNYDTKADYTRFEYAVTKLIEGPSGIQKFLNTYSEIPVNTEIIAIIQEPDKNIIDLTSSFDSGGGAESTYKKLSQIIKTVEMNADRATYLFINGIQTEVFGGEGIMITQPLGRDSL